MFMGGEGQSDLSGNPTRREHDHDAVTSNEDINIPFPGPTLSAYFTEDELNLFVEQTESDAHNQDAQDLKGAWQEVERKRQSGKMPSGNDTVLTLITDTKTMLNKVPKQPPAQTQ